MALTIYQSIEPDGNFPAVKAKDVEMPDGTRLGDLDLGSMNVVSYDLASMGAPNLVVDGASLQIDTDTTEITQAMATSIVCVGMNVEYGGLVFPVKAVFVPNGNVATVNLLTTVAFISVFVTEGKIILSAKLAKGNSAGSGHVVQDTPPDDKSVLWVDPTDNSDDGFQEAVKAALAQANCGIAVTGATVGQIVMIAEVDEKGVPTAWEAVDFPSGGGGGKWRYLGRFETDEDVVTFIIDTDVNGIPFSLREVCVQGVLMPNAAAATGWVRPFVNSGTIAEASILYGLDASSRDVGRAFRYSLVVRDGTCFLEEVLTGSENANTPYLFKSGSDKYGDIRSMIKTDSITKVGIGGHQAGTIGIGTYIDVWGIDA